MIVLILQFFCYNLLSIVWNILQKIFWICNGTNDHLQQCRKPDCNYENGAQVFDVKLRFKSDKIVLPNRQENFLGFHQEFVHPNYVLKNEVSLYCADDKYAMFVEAPLGVQVWKHQYGSFHKPAQFYSAIRYIRMPTWAFNRLADEIGEPPATVIITEFLPRSGSTLLCQLFEYTDKCVVFSEPSVFHDTDRQWTDDQVRYFKSCLRLLCKAVDGMDVKAYMIKMTPWIREDKTFMQKAIPNNKFLFLYRDILKCSTSLATVTNASNAFKFIFLLESIFGKHFRRSFFNFFRQNCDVELNDAVMEIFLRTSNIRLFHAFLMQCVIFKVSYEHCKADHNTPSIKYEHIIANPESCVSTIFAHCGLHQELVEPALRALQKDSQANSPVAKDKVHKYKPSQVDAQLEDEMTTTAKAMDIPLLTNNNLMFNTITH